MYGFQLQSVIKLDSDPALTMFGIRIIIIWFWRVHNTGLAIIDIFYFVLLLFVNVISAANRKYIEIDRWWSYLQNRMNKKQYIRIRIIIIRFRRIHSSGLTIIDILLLYVNVYLQLIENILRLIGVGPLFRIG